MLTLIVLGLVGLTVIFDLLPNIRKRPKKESVIYCALLFAGFCVLLLYSLDVMVPGPSGLIRGVVESLFPVQ